MSLQYVLNIIQVEGQTALETANVTVASRPFLVQLAVVNNFEMEAVTVQLEQLTLADVVETGRKLGSGAYGKVVEVCFSGLKCAGKKLHAVFFDRSPSDEQRAILSRFAEECVT